MLYTLYQYTLYIPINTLNKFFVQTIVYLYATKYNILMDMSELIEDFMEYLQIERGRSINTSEAYKHYLERFLEFAGFDLKVENIRPELVRKYRLWLNRYQTDRGGTVSLITQNYHLIALRGFLDYLSKRDIESMAPNKIELPRVHRKQVTFLYSDEVQRILDTIPADDSLPALRDRAILELLFSSGLRVSELISLNKDHVNMQRREFTVRGKGQKDRPVFISKRAAEHVQNYLSARTDSLQPLFLNYSRNNGVTNTSGNYRRLSLVHTLCGTVSQPIYL